MRDNSIGGNANVKTEMIEVEIVSRFIWLYVTVRLLRMSHVWP